MVICRLYVWAISFILLAWDGLWSAKRSSIEPSMASAIALPSTVVLPWGFLSDSYSFHTFFLAAATALAISSIFSGARPFPIAAFMSVEAVSRLLLNAWAFFGLTACVRWVSTSGLIALRTLVIPCLAVPK